MTPPEVEALIRTIATARAEKAKQRKARDAAAAAFDKADRDVDEAVSALGKVVKVKKGEDVFFDVDGERWHLEREGKVLRVERAKPE